MTHTIEFSPVPRIWIQDSQGKYHIIEYLETKIGWINPYEGYKSVEIDEILKQAVAHTFVLRYGRYYVVGEIWGEGLIELDVKMYESTEPFSPLEGILENTNELIRGFERFAEEEWLKVEEAVERYLGYIPVINMEREE